MRQTFLIAALVAAAAPMSLPGATATAQLIEPVATSFRPDIERIASPAATPEIKLLSQHSIDRPALAVFDAIAAPPGVLSAPFGVAGATAGRSERSRGPTGESATSIKSDTSACMERTEGQRFIRASTNKVSYAPLNVTGKNSSDGGWMGTGLLSLPFLVGAALAGERNTKRRDGRDFDYPVKAGVKIFAGSIVALNGAVAAPGATAVGRKTVGRAKTTVDNTAGADTALRVPVERGVFQFGNSAAADAITLAEVGSTAYLVDDQTVAKTDGVGTRSAAGIIRDVDAGGVWVEI